MATEYSRSRFHVQAVSSRNAHKCAPDVVDNIKLARDKGELAKCTQLIADGFWVLFTERVAGPRLVTLNGLAPADLKGVIKAVATLYQGLKGMVCSDVGQLTFAQGNVYLGPICHIGKDRPFLRSNDYHFDTIHRRMKEILHQPSGTIDARLDQYIFLLDLMQAMRGCRDLSANSSTYLKHGWLDTSSIFLTDGGPKILDWAT